MNRKELEKMSKENLIEIIEQLYLAYDSNEGLGPVVHRCMRCGSTCTAEDKLASCPSYRT